MNETIRKRLDAAWRKHFGDPAGCRLFYSPSRINIIGEHIDYNGGNVFPCAIDIGTYALVRKNDLGRLRLHSENVEGAGDLTLPVGDYEEDRGWLNYPVGIVKRLTQEGYHVEGFDAVIYGDIPNGSGLSSSASIELLFTSIINELFNDGKIAPIEMIHAGVWCENEFFGLHTGIMDQYVIGLGKKDHAMLLDTSAETHVYVPFKLPGASIVILNTNKRRELKDSKYNERRGECEEALKHLREKKDIQFLCDLGLEDLPLVESLEDEVLRKRARHVVTENARVAEAVQAMKDGDLVRLGELLRESHRSLRYDYEVTGLHLDAITDAANAVEGCYGARMTGAGFSGCGIAVVKNEAIDHFKEVVGREYFEKTGLKAQFIESLAADGVHEIR